MIRFGARSAIFALTLAPVALAAEGKEDTLFSPFTDTVTNLVMLGILIFFAIVWRAGAFKQVLGGLDSRAEAIRSELDEAASLRAQAAAALADVERKQLEAGKEAEAIIAQARRDAATLMETATKNLAERIARREAQAESRIARAEADAADQVRRVAADTATEAARRVMAASPGADQFENAAKEIERALS